MSLDRITFHTSNPLQYANELQLIRSSIPFPQVPGPNLPGLNRGWNLNGKTFGMILETDEHANANALAYSRERADGTKDPSDRYLLGRPILVLVPIGTKAAACQKTYVEINCCSFLR